MTKKMLAVLGMVGFLSTAGVALAQTTATGSTVAPSTVTTLQPRTEPMVLEVGAAGRVLLRGTVESASAGSLTVKSWGGNWTITVPANAEVLPRGTAVSGFGQGDFVGVLGTVNQNASFTIDAKIVRDWTARMTARQGITRNVRTVHEMMRSETPRVVEGTLSNLDASAETFTLTARSGANYSVSLVSGAKTLQRNWATLDFSTVQNGDTVRVWGPVASSTISASVFRDVSVPRQ
jgi:hypothetical protein